MTRRPIFIYGGPSPVSRNLFNDETGMPDSWDANWTFTRRNLDSVDLMFAVLLQSGHPDAIDDTLYKSGFSVVRVIIWTALLLSTEWNKSVQISVSDILNQCSEIIRSRGDARGVQRPLLR
jgi:hypothetical protein